MKAKLASPKNKGWRQQSIRHSNARKFGKAGGPYSSNPGKTVIYTPSSESKTPVEDILLQLKGTHITAAERKRFGPRYRALGGDEQLEFQKKKFRIKQEQTKTQFAMRAKALKIREAKLEELKEARKEKLEELRKIKERRLGEIKRAEEAVEQERQRKIEVALREKAERKRYLLLPEKHLGKRRELLEKIEYAGQKGDTEQLTKFKGRLAKLEAKEPKLYVKGQERYTKLRAAALKLSEQRRKVLASRLTQRQRLLRKRKWVKFKKAVKIPYASLRVAHMTRNLPTQESTELQAENIF